MKSTDSVIVSWDFSRGKDVGANEEVCLIRKDFNKKILSDECLNMEVECIENDECILDTVNIHVKKV